MKNETEKQGLTVGFSVATVVYLVALGIAWISAGGIDGNVVSFRVWIFFGIWISGAIFAVTLMNKLTAEDTDRYSTGFANLACSLFGGTILSIGLSLVTLIPLSFIF